MITLACEHRTLYILCNIGNYREAISYIAMLTRAFFIISSVRMCFVSYYDIANLINIIEIMCYPVCNNLFR